MTTTLTTFSFLLPIAVAGFPHGVTPPCSDAIFAREDLGRGSSPFPKLRPLSGGLGRVRPREPEQSRLRAPVRVQLVALEPEVLARELEVQVLELSGPARELARLSTWPNLYDLRGESAVALARSFRCHCPNCGAVAQENLIRKVPELRAMVAEGSFRQIDGPAPNQRSRQVLRLLSLSLSWLLWPSGLVPPFVPVVSASWPLVRVQRGVRRPPTGFPNNIHLRNTSGCSGDNQLRGRLSAHSSRNAGEILRGIPTLCVPGHPCSHVGS